MARRTTRPVVRAQRRQSLWIPFAVGPSVSAANALTLVFSLNADGLDLAPFTVVRTRGLVTMWSDQSTAAEVPEGILGFIVVQNTAVLIGTSAIPDPLNEAAADFFVYQPMHNQTMRLTASTGTDGFTEPSKTEYVIDSKAMRKVDVQQDIAVVIRNTSASDGLAFFLTGRMLVKLH